VALNKKETLFATKLDFNFREQLVKCYIWYVALYDAETRTRLEIDQKYLEIFYMWCWRMVEKISWTDHVRNEEVCLRVKEDRNVLYAIKRGDAIWIGHSWLRNCFLQQVIEGKIEGRIEVTRKCERRCKHLLNDLKERR